MAISWQWTAVMVVASVMVICTPGFVQGTPTDDSCAAILCLSPSRCENGKCILICEQSGTADCNGDFGDGCEVNTMNDVSNPSPKSPLHPSPKSPLNAGRGTCACTGQVQRWQVQIGE